MVIFHSYVTVYQEGTPWYPHHNFLKSPRISGISLRLAESTPLLSIPVLSLNALFAALDCSLRTANGERPRHGTEGMGYGQHSWELGGICIYLYMNLYEHVPTPRLKLFFFLMAMCLVQTFLLTSTSAKHLHEKGITLPCSLQSTDSQIK